MSSLSTVVSRIAHESVRSAPSIMPSGDWWNNLESNFHRRPEGFDLPVRDQIQVSAMVASDKALRTGLALLVSGLAVPLGYRPSKLKRAYEQRDLYQKFADERDAEGFFKRPPKGVPIRRKQRPVHNLGDDAIVEDWSFESPFEAVHPAFDELIHKQNRNSIARAKYMRHKDGPRPTVIFIHGFCADPYWLNEKVFAIPSFFHAGCDVLLFTLPHHGKRQERFSPFSGHGFIASGISGLNEAFAQAVYDFRIFLDFLLEDIGAPQAGVTGISLGGYTSALLATVEDRLAFSVPNVPVASLPDLMMEWPPLSYMYRAAMALSGVSLKQVRHFTAAHCPLTYEPILPRERLMVIGGVGDRFAPPKHTRLIWDHWGRCRIHWFPGSHVIHLDQGAYMHQMMMFMKELDFLTDEYAKFPETKDVLRLPRYEWT
jgi:pimeloyl-ACP methyl ester carboxylesterase